MDKKIINVVTLYQNEQEVLTYANELSSQSIANKLDLIVVLNKKGSMELDEFKKELESIKINSFIYTPSKNLGYLNGLIFGYNSYRKNFTMPDWVVMSNTDIKFKDKYFFEKFISFNYNNDVWCIGPSIYSPSTCSYENPQYLKRHTLAQLNRRIFIFKRYRLAYFYMLLSLLKARLLKKKKKQSCYCYSVHGSFFILKGEFVEMIKALNYGALMYSEEAFIAEIIYKFGKKVFYDSNIELIHFGSTVTSKINIQQKSKYFVESFEYIRDQFYIQ